MLRKLAAISIALLMGVSALVPAGPARAGDADAGKRVYNKCKICHEIAKERNKIGPHLVNIIGRQAAMAEGFKYSNAIRERAAKGLVWTEEAIAEFVRNPRTYIPKNKMAFAGLKKPIEIEDLIAYLRAETGS